jgi:hypothetical protein
MAFEAFGGLLIMLFHWILYNITLSNTVSYLSDDAGHIHVIGSIRDR